KFINTKIYALSVSNAHSIFARISYINFFVRNVLAQFLRGVSASYRKGKLWMHNFNEEHPQVIENVGCRCKIFKGSILKSQKSKSIIVPPISIMAHHKARQRLCNPANWSRACPTKLSRSA
ncbi:MAG: hypothetical protein EGQ79_03655, partial [Ruminococcus sp.]|nr:hypothetical protein [Ruminococcus sp.]